ncbi:MAG: translocation/assembly module TamB domain-containing protein [Rubrivivax sp.]|nr:translocation/assembly module TamB domain-containing protein [Rubrivivax sp.]
MARRRVGLWITVATVAALGLAAVTLPPLLLRSEGATAWLLKRVPGLQVEAQRGALLGDDLGAERLVWQGTAGRLELQGLAIKKLRWQWRPAPGQWLGLQAEHVTLRALLWQSAPASSTPLTAPATLRLPVSVQTPLQVGRVQIDGQAPVLDLSAKLDLGAAAGAEHRIETLRFRRDQLQAEGQAQIGSDAPFPLSLTAQAHALPSATLPWRATLQAQGPLDRLALQGTLRGQADNAALDLQSTLTPFAPWPLAALSARTRDLDLAALASGWPQTRLNGEATLRSSARDAPFLAELTLQNQQPGRWNEGRLPLRQAELRLRALLAQPDRVAIEAFTLQLADASASAGRWAGSGEWLGHTLTLDTRVEGLQPQRVDGRAAAMQLGGALQGVLTGLPSPDPQAGPSATSATPPTPWRATLQGRLEGRLSTAPTPVQVVLDASASAEQFQLRSLQARTGTASAEASATLRRAGAGWSLASEGRLADFDPLPWWPGPEDSPWRRGPHKLNGDWTLALTLPDRALARTHTQPEAWRALAGQAQLRLAPSQLAGVPVQGQLSLSPGAQVQAALDLAGNQLTISGQADPLADGRADRWQLTLRAPALAALAPLAALHPALAPWAPRGGQAEADATLQGRWPVMAGSGHARLQALGAGPLALGQGTLQWRLSADATGGTEQPLNATVAMTDLAWRGQKVPVASAELAGTLASHRLRIDAALPLVPPAVLEQTFALKSQRGTRLALRGDGQAQHGPEGWRWTGQLESLTAGGWDGRVPLAGTPPRDWLDAGPLRAELALGPDGGLQRLRADAGRLKLAGDIALAWDEVRYDTGALTLRARLESLRVAPLLARWQPDLGWDGDLRVGATLDLKAGERFDADLVFERQGGDLQVRDTAEAPLALGLTDLRLALNAHDGTWTFTQALAGRTLGAAGGLLRVQTTPDRRWPGPDAVVDGGVQARVANLGIWGAWVPPGWRLEGALETDGVFSGRFANPAVNGTLSGSGLGVRNLLQGVNVTGGDVLLRLEGNRANIERFSFRAGTGTLTVTGGADLVNPPEARLQLRAEQFQVLGRVDRRLVASGNAELTLKPQSLALKGKLNVDEALFDASRSDAPSLADDVNVRRPGAPEVAAADPTTTRKPRSTDVALDISLGQQLKVRGRGLDTLLRGDLRISAPTGRLAVNGTVNAERGTYAAYGQKLAIQRGIVAFYGPADNPRLDVLALRPNLDIEVGVAITGTAQSPRIRLHSDPELSDTDKLAWLVLGRDPGGLGRADTALLQRAAIALLAGEGEAPTDTLIRSLGLDELSVRQSDDSTSETIVTLGKQLSQRWYVGYERGVNATVGTWQLIYRAAQRFTLRAQSGAENSLDLIWIWRVP